MIDTKPDERGDAAGLLSALWGQPIELPNPYAYLGPNPLLEFFRRLSLCYEPPLEPMPPDYKFKWPTMEECRAYTEAMKDVPPS